MTVLRDLMRAEGSAFAVIHRAATPSWVDIYTGDLVTAERLADLPLPPVDPGDPVQREDILALVPYRQLAERGYPCVDDGAPLLALVVAEHTRVALAQAMADLPDDPIEVRGGAFDLDDDAYADVVRRVLAEEIGRGAGSNFVIRRTYHADLGPVCARTGLSILRRLLLRERGAYWTFLVRAGGRTLVGATPERHVSLRGGNACMTPISGTYRYPPTGPTTEGLLDFLADAKEIDELSMVVDEELKMMAEVCFNGVHVSGARLREMARLAHTEYVIEGRTGADVRDILAATMFAPTVVGSPLRSASRVVAEYERTGRGYYGGVLALLGREGGARTMDSAICLRAASIDPAGRVAIDVGATIVRGSDPAAEAAETTAKAAGLLDALGGGAAAAQPRSAATPRLGADWRVRAALTARTQGLARFWFTKDRAPEASTVLIGRRIVIVDAEDGFTRMLGHQIRSLGATIEIRSYRDVLRGGEADTADADAVVVGPGPGDPLDLADGRIAALHRITASLLRQRVPFLSVCLGHQVLAATVGLPVRRKAVPTQGTQREIAFGGALVRVGCYNTFAAYSAEDEVVCAVTGVRVSVLRDPHTGEVNGLSMPRARSVQFHVESILTEDGPALLTALFAPIVCDSA